MRPLRSWQWPSSWNILQLIYHYSCVLPKNVLCRLKRLYSIINHKPTWLTLNSAPKLAFPWACMHSTCFRKPSKALSVIAGWPSLSDLPVGSKLHHTSRCRKYSNAHMCVCRHVYLNYACLYNNIPKHAHTFWYNLQHGTCSTSCIIILASYLLLNILCSSYCYTYNVMSVITI